MQSGKIIIVTAPSGAGKTTIVHYLLQQIPSLAFSVSATTRPRRDNEIEGEDYYFLSEDDFRKKIAEQAFAEWEEVYPGKMYGTLKEEIRRLWSMGKTIIFDVDVLGARSLKNMYPGNSLALFIMPPSLDALTQRLAKRKTEDEGSFNARMERARMELEHAGDFDVTIVNDDLSKACDEAFRLVSDFLKQDAA